jgi:L-threonylcarbamoyladenylate synthase
MSAASPLSEADALALQECLAAGGVAVLPTDTVYGLACEPSSSHALCRLYELKGRPPAKPAAVMFFSLARALPRLEWLGDRTKQALTALLPGPVTLLLPNPRRLFPLACEPDGMREHPAPLGLRVPAWPPQLAALGAVEIPALQSSANLSGEPAPRTLSEVPKQIRDGADLVLDGGELRGLASTVIDLSDFETDGTWGVTRDGALEVAAIERRIAAIRLH